MDIDANVTGRVGDRVLPPPNATHVIFGAGLKGEDTLKLAIVAPKEQIFDQNTVFYQNAVFLLEFDRSA